VSFVTDITDVVVCPGFWKTRKMEKSAFSRSAVSTVHTSSTQHCCKTH